LSARPAERRGGGDGFACIGMVDMNGIPVVFIDLDGHRVVLPISAVRIMVDALAAQADMAEAKAAGRETSLKAPISRVVGS
jgi:hypothetical protein